MASYKGKENANPRSDGDSDFEVETIIGRLDRVHYIFLKEVEEIKDRLVKMASVFDKVKKQHVEFELKMLRKDEQLIKVEKKIEDLKKENEQLKKEKCVKRCSEELKQMPLSEIQPLGNNCARNCGEPVNRLLQEKEMVHASKIGQPNAEDSASLELPGPSLDNFGSSENVQDKQRLDDTPVQGVKDEQFDVGDCVDEEILGPDCMDHLSAQETEDQDSPDNEVLQAVNPADSTSAEFIPVCELNEECEQAGPFVTESLTEPSAVMTFYQCDICQARFGNWILLQSHMKCHGDRTGLKKHKCTLCAYSTNNFTDLRNHMRTHTKEKPYVCNVCHKAFTVSSSLQRHLRTHTKEKPYVCDVCHRAFTQNGGLHKHMRTVHAENHPLLSQTEEAQQGEILSLPYDGAPTLHKSPSTL